MAGAEGREEPGGGRPGEAAPPGDQHEEWKEMWVVSQGRGCVCPHRGLGHTGREQEMQL